MTLFASNGAWARDCAYDTAYPTSTTAYCVAGGLGTTLTCNLPGATGTATSTAEAVQVSTTSDEELHDNGYDLRSWDETVTTVDVTVNADAGNDAITLPTNNVGHAFTVLGRAGDDVITGSPLTDIINGGADDDDIYGEGGNDDVFGDSGQDLIEGGDGDDRLDGGIDLDTIRGEDGADTICGGDLIDANDLHGGNGADVIWSGDSTASGRSDISGDAPTAGAGDLCDFGGTGTVTDCETPISTAPGYCS